MKAAKEDEMLRRKSKLSKTKTIQIPLIMRSERSRGRAQGRKIPARARSYSLSLWKSPRKSICKSVRSEELPGLPVPSKSKGKPIHNWLSTELLCDKWRNEQNSTPTKKAIQEVMPTELIKNCNLIFWHNLKFCRKWQKLWKIDMN